MIKPSPTWSRKAPNQRGNALRFIGEIVEDKLYTSRIQDSLEVSDAEIYSYVDQSIEYFTEQLGSLKMWEFYKKTDELSFREELSKSMSLKLSQMMQTDMVEKVEVTPEEVRQFFDSIPEEDHLFLEQK